MEDEGTPVPEEEAAEPPEVEAPVPVASGGYMGVVKRLGFQPVHDLRLSSR